MVKADLVDLESAIRDLPGVLSCVILTDEAGTLSEIEAFVEAGFGLSEAQASITDEITRRGLQETVRNVMVIELEAESLSGDREALERLAEEAGQQVRSGGTLAAAEALSALAEDFEDAAEPALVREGARPPLRRVNLSATSNTYEAEVELGGVLGTATGDKTAHGLGVVAEATLRAAAALVGRDDFQLQGAVVVDVVGRKGVTVIVRVADGLELIGSALVRDEPVSQAAVRATLDAINRNVMLGA